MDDCKQIRVALVCEFEQLNGAERSLLATIDQLSGKSVRYSAICPSEGALTQAFVQRGIPVFPMDWKDAQGKTVPLEERRARFAQIIEACQRDAQRAVDLIHANSLSSTRMSGPVCRERGIPSIGHIRDIIRLKKQVIDDINCHKTILCVSEAVRRFHCEQGLNAANAFVAYNGVDINEFRPRTAPLDLSGLLDLPDLPDLPGFSGFSDSFDLPDLQDLSDSPNSPTAQAPDISGQKITPPVREPHALRIGMAGQISLRKGMDVLLEAIEILENNRRIATSEANDETIGEAAPLTFEIVGSRQSEKRETVLLEERIRAAAPRVNDRAAVDCGIQVRFPGQLDSLSSWLRTLDIYVHAARQEPLGRVLLEAAATGLPVIATNVGGTGEIFPASDESNALRARPFSFQNRQGAFLVPPDDPQKLADALLRLTSGPQAGLWRARMGEQGRRRITERFSNVLAAQTLQSYYILAAGQAAQGVR